MLAGMKMDEYDCMPSSILRHILKSMPAMSSTDNNSRKQTGGVQSGQRSRRPELLPMGLLLPGNLRMIDMKKTFKCSTCGTITKTRANLCNPVELERRVDHCSPSTSDANICEKEKARLEYECGVCGRQTDDSSLVCIPNKVHSV